MKLLRIILLMLLVCALFFCNEDPASPKNNNPFDTKNQQTQGNPFRLKAKVAHGGITLTWIALDIPELKNYKIYRSESVDSTFSLLITLSASDTSTIDINVANGHSYWYKVTAVNVDNEETNQTNIYAINIKTEPLFIINDGNQYSSSRNVALTILANTAQEMIFSNDSIFSNVSWEQYATTKNWILPVGEGEKTVYMKVKYDSTESSIITASIRNLPMEPSIQIVTDTVNYTLNRDVVIELTANGTNLQTKISEDSTFSNVTYQSYAPSHLFQLSNNDGIKTVYVKFFNDFEIESPTVKDKVILDTTPPLISLNVYPDSGITNSTLFQFDPIGSTDNLTPADSIRIRYDYENDGYFDTSWDFLSVNNYRFTLGGGNKISRTQMMDQAGLVSDTTINLFINTYPEAIVTSTVDSENSLLYHFDLSASTDYEDGSDLEYRWDLDGDGNWDSNFSQISETSFEYPVYDIYSPRFEVKDKDNLSRINILYLDVKLIVQWSYSYGGGGDDFASAVFQTSDGGYILGGQTDSYGAGNSDFFVVKTDPQGNLQWNKTYGGSGLDRAFDVRPTNDNGYVLVGHTYSYGAGRDDMWLVKCDENGNLEWDQTYGGTNNDWGNSVEQTDDNGYILSGFSFSDENNGIWLVKTDAVGNLEWEQTYGGTTANAAKQCSDGGYIVAGYSTIEGNPWDIVVVKTDDEGNQEWRKLFGGGINEYSSDVLQTDDGGFIITGQTASYGSGSYDIWMIKLDVSGNIVWNKTYGGSRADYSDEVIPTIDGGYIIAGNTYSFDNSSSRYFWIVKTDANGNMIWNQEFSNGTSATGIVEIEEGVYVIGGYSGGYSMKLIKIY